MIRYFCFHSSMKEVKVLCLFCSPPANFTFIHVTFSVFSLNNVVRMLFLDLVTIRRTSWFHLKYLVLLPHAQLEIEVKWTWFRRNIKMVSWRFGPGAGAPSTLDWVLTSSNWSQSICFWILQNPNCVSESAAASVRWRRSPERWTWTTLLLKENPLQDTKKKTPGFYHKEGFLWIHRTLSGAFISNQASFHAALKCTGTYKNHSRSRQRVGEVNMSKGSEITNKWGFYRFMFCWREKNSLTFYNIN